MESIMESWNGLTGWIRKIFFQRQKNIRFYVAWLTKKEWRSLMKKILFRILRQKLEKWRIIGFRWKNLYQKSVVRMLFAIFTVIMNSIEKNWKRLILMICWYFVMNCSGQDQMYLHSGRRNSDTFWLMNFRILIEFSMMWSACWHSRKIICS